MIQIQDDSQVKQDNAFAGTPMTQTLVSPVQNSDQKKIVDQSQTPNPNQTPVTMPAANMNQPAAQVTNQAPPSVNANSNPIQGLVGDMKVSDEQKTESSETTVSESEIDDLLAQLEKLSQEIEAKADKEEAVLAESPEEENSQDEDFSSDDEYLARLEKKIAEEKATREQDEDTVAEERMAAPKADKDEEFDMDKFLADLEKKIEEQNAASQTDSSADEVADNKEESVQFSPRVPDFPDQNIEDKKEAEVKDDEQEEVSFRKNRPQLAVDEDEAVAELEEENDNPKAEIEEDQSEESLAAQSIFEMLKIEDISAEEREQFLNELEDLIWQDFIESDLQLLLTREEYAKADAILKDAKSEDEKKEELLLYIEKLHPDIEEIMYEKALNLKEEMFYERVRKLEESNPSGESLKLIQKAKEDAQSGLWRTAVDALNQL